MPVDESYWNPYRWVTVSEEPVARREPAYHHRFSGTAGRLWCELEALTPILVGDGKGKFVVREKDKKPFLPATSIKGVIRSLAELVGNAAVPFGQCQVDQRHALSAASEGHGANWRLDIVARTFGYLHQKQAFAGLVHFSDGTLVAPSLGPGIPPAYDVVVGQPKPQHAPFYPDQNRRKFYHHRVGAEGLTTTSLAQKQTVRPLPPKTTFVFTVDFSNLQREELALLVYCIALEEKVTVTLSPQAIGPEARQPASIVGPLRHKLGGCKPHGGGSVHIRITKMQLRGDPAARYRGQSEPPVLEGQALEEEISRLTQPFCSRADETMQQLRAMLIYSNNDPRRDVRYPDYQWFQGQKQAQEKKPLKPTM